MKEPKKDVTIEDLAGMIDNKYLAVLVAAKRARQLNTGMLPSIKTSALKETTVALQELVAKKLDLVELKSPSDPKIDASSVFNLESTDEDDLEDDLVETEYVDDSDYVDRSDDNGTEEEL